MRSKRPRFLALDTDGSVLVAPGVSGNNSTVTFTPDFEPAIVNLADPAIARIGLPDSDLFRLRPPDSTLRPVLRGMGSLLFAHGRNPVTGEYWMLNVASLNADPAHQGEAALRGSFAENRLSIASLPGTGNGALLRTIVESCPTKLLLANPAVDRRHYAELFQLNEMELDLLTGLIPRQQILLKRPDLAKVLTLAVDPKSYWIYTNTPIDNARVAETFREYGFEAGLDRLAASA